MAKENSFHAQVSDCLIDVHLQPADPTCLTLPSYSKLGRAVTLSILAAVKVILEVGARRISMGCLAISPPTRDVGRLTTVIYVI